MVGVDSVIWYMMWLETQTPYTKNFAQEYPRDYGKLWDYKQKLRWRLENGFIPERFWNSIV